MEDMDCRYTLGFVRPDSTEQNVQSGIPCTAQGSTTQGSAGRSQRHTGRRNLMRSGRLGRRLRQCAAGFMLMLSLLAVNMSSSVFAQNNILPGQSGYQGEGTGARMRLGFELRQISTEDAEKIINGTVPGGTDAVNRWGNHYIELWAYAYFDVPHFSKYVSYEYDAGAWNTQTNSWGAYVNKWNLLPQSLTLSYVLQKNKGDISAANTDVNMTNAKIASGGNNEWGLDQPAGQSYLTTTSYEKGAAGYGMLSSSSSGQNIGNYQVSVDTVYLDDGIQYFRVKMFPVRFVWTQKGSFYASFANHRTSTGSDVIEDKSIGLVTWKVYYNSIISSICGGDAASDRTDWMQGSGYRTGVSNTIICPGASECMKFLQGGVEIKSGFSATLSPEVETVCPGSESSRTLRITGYKSSDVTWSDAECYVERYLGGGNWGNSVAVASSGNASSSTCR
ncbi:MAG: hypothetical protein K2K11_05660, partial [Bacteroidales bacterium]|nr:hypothetical protein [Bacteroidales bacterium]